MVTLFQIWLVSALVLIGIMFYAYVNAVRQQYTAIHTRLRFADFVFDEVSLLHRDIFRLVEKAKPQGQRTARAGMVIVKRGQEFFTSRIFGRIESERGRASSFFLKQIIEHKERDVERGNDERSV
ncbi:MAG: hypothetical protein UY04_C0055G0004 [Parcubacteria group bacterium GW2011_GWA2_47_7]|nr:MAG: hypothetical protein UY04_C0055G0004 [Parcubacteria group bacterium GW2011_GWA2_47_7]